jgi:hypothetical protein
MSRLFIIQYIYVAYDIKSIFIKKIDFFVKLKVYYENLVSMSSEASKASKSEQEAFKKYFHELHVQGGNSKWCHPPVLQRAFEYANTNPPEQNFKQKWLAALLCFTVILLPCRYGGAMPEPPEETQQKVLIAGKELLDKFEEHDIDLERYKFPDGHNPWDIFLLFGWIGKQK